MTVSLICELSSKTMNHGLNTLNSTESVPHWPKNVTSTFKVQNQSMSRDCQWVMLCQVPSNSNHRIWFMTTTYQQTIIQIKALKHVCRCDVFVTISFYNFTKLLRSWHWVNTPAYVCVFEDKTFESVREHLHHKSRQIIFVLQQRYQVIKLVSFSLIANVGRYREQEQNKKPSCH